MRKTHTMTVPCSSIPWSHRTRGIRPPCRFSSPPSLAACSARGSAGGQSGWQQVFFLLQCFEILIVEISSLLTYPSLPRVCEWKLHLEIVFLTDLCRKERIAESERKNCELQKRHLAAKASDWFPVWIACPRISRPARSWLITVLGTWFNLLW